MKRIGEISAKPAMAYTPLIRITLNSGGYAVNNKFPNHTLFGVAMRFASLICLCAANVPAETTGSERKGVIYRNPRVYNVEYTFEMFPDPNKTEQDRDLKLWVPIPREWDSQKAVKIISVQPEPHAKYVDPEYGNSMLFWDFGKEPQKPSYKVKIRCRLEQYETYAHIDPNRIGPYDKKNKDYALYTRSTNTVTITDKVKELAKIAVGDEKNPYLQAKRIYEFVRKKMCYGRPDVQGEKRGVEAILDCPVIDQKTGQEYYLGVCFDQSMVFVALCRAVGIPARNVSVFWDWSPWNRKKPKNPEPGTELPDLRANGSVRLSRNHGWAEIHLPNYGWVPIDPTFGRFGHSNVNNRAVIISKGRDIQIDPRALREGDDSYKTLGATLHGGRIPLLLGGVFHTATIQSIKRTKRHQPDPFPANALAEYAAKLYPETESERNLGLYRKRTLRWIDQNTRGHTDKIAALTQAYEKEPRARYEHEAFICYMLRKLVGEKKFSKIFETYTDLRVKSGESISTARFQKIAEEVYGRPLDWFFDQWVEYTELPQLQLDTVTFSEDERGWHIRGTLRQLNKSLFRLSVEIVLETEKKAECKTLWLEDKETEFEFSTTSKPKGVLVDPNNDILQIREMPLLLENPSYDEITFCTVTDQDKADLYGLTPLHFAAEAGQTDIVDYLIAAGADVDAENISGETPLQFAVDKGHTEIVELLKKHGAKE